MPLQPSPLQPSSRQNPSVARVQSLVNQMSLSATSFSAEVVPQAPEDPMFGLMRLYKADEYPSKVDVVCFACLFVLFRAISLGVSTCPPLTYLSQSIGAYRDNNAKPWVLPVVKEGMVWFSCPSPHCRLPTRRHGLHAKLPGHLFAGAYRLGPIPLHETPLAYRFGCALQADEILRDDPNLDHEYAPIAGIASFTSKAAELIIGADSPAIKEKRVTSVQTISGTGAVHLGALFLARFFPRHQEGVHLQPDMGQPQPDLLQCRPARRPISLLLQADKGLGLRWHEGRPSPRPRNGPSSSSMPAPTTQPVSTLPWISGRRSPP